MMDGSIHRRWQTLTTREIRDERDAWSTSSLTLLKRRDDLNRVTPAWLRRLNITQRTAVMARADHESGTDRRINLGKPVRNLTCLGGSELAERVKGLEEWLC